MPVDEAEVTLSGDLADLDPVVFSLGCVFEADFPIGRLSLGLVEITRLGAQATTLKAKLATAQRPITVRNFEFILHHLRFQSNFQSISRLEAPNSRASLTGL